MKIFSQCAIFNHHTLNLVNTEVVYIHQHTNIDFYPDPENAASRRKDARAPQ